MKYFRCFPIHRCQGYRVWSHTSHMEISVAFAIPQCAQIVEKAHGIPWEQLTDPLVSDKPNTALYSTTERFDCIRSGVFTQENIR